MKTKKAKKLSVKTGTRLRAVAQAILKEHTLYDQWNCTPERGCGTPGCLLGWACLLFAKRVPAPGRGAMTPGAKALGITYSQAGKLYVPSSWPSNFIRSLAYAEKGSFTYACVAVARIEHFIATNGAE